jgi:hypothetical protein
MTSVMWEIWRRIVTPNLLLYVPTV